MKKTTAESNTKISVTETEIFHAIRHSQYKQLELYIRHNYNLNVTSKDGRNALFYALDINNPTKRVRMIKYCLDHGINPLQREKTNGFTILHETIVRQQLDSFQLLLDEFLGEIDWNTLDSQGRTILHLAVETNNTTILDALVSIARRFYISVDVFDKNGLTPYLLAVKLHFPDMARILLEKGRASRYRCDLQTHYSAQQWDAIGIMENSLNLRRKIRHEIDEAKTKGKITKVNKLKKLYSSTSVLPTNDKLRRDSYVTSTTRSGVNVRSSLSINELIDQLSEGDIPETFVNSRTDKRNSYLEHVVPQTLPPLKSYQQQRPNMSFNSISDLFQIAQLSS